VDVRSVGCVRAMWMDALKKCTVEDKMGRSRARRSVGRMVGRSPTRGSGARVA
jgi:hypothetical protein